MKREEARKKAEALVSRMTLEEKASQLRYDAPPIRRLGIPAYNWWNEALHGIARAGQATVFPQAIGLGATFDPELLEETADVISTEGRAKYNAYSKQEDRDIYKGLTFWSPNVNIFRDPRWGRGHETYGEDPYLTSRLGVAFVKGLQGQGETLKAAACAKHFAVHSGPEELRHEFDSQVSQKDLHETYLPAFQALVEEAGVEAIMGAYNRTNGEPCCASPSLMKTLRGDWGFQGHFLSDCWAIQDFHMNHMVTHSPMESAALAINTGCDLNCGSTYLHVLNACEHGLVTEETVTESAVRLFTTRYLLGLFDGSEYDDISYLEVESKEHLALAEKAALESFVLLKNNGILPLKKQNLKTVGVIGPNADSRVALIGNYHGTASRYVTVLEGIQDYLGEEVRVLTSAGCALFREKTEDLAMKGDRLSEARIVAEHSDVVILCVGLDETLEGEQGDAGNGAASGDKLDLLLPGVQRELLETVAQCGKPVILCMMSGSDLDMSYAMEHFDAILQLWYPGAQGGKAAAKVLFGEVSPSGKLPITFYQSIEELPDFEDYAMKGRTYRYMEGKAQYPFGYGLTYGEVQVTETKILKERAGACAGCGSASNPENAAAPETVAKSGILLEVTAENSGSMDTDEVLQVYVKHTDSPLASKHPSLCAFQRIHLKAGEKAAFPIEVSDWAFTLLDETGKRIAEKGTFALFVGVSQPDERSVELTGKAPVKLEIMR